MDRKLIYVPLAALVASFELSIAAARICEPRISAMWTTPFVLATAFILLLISAIGIIHLLRTWWKTPTDKPPLYSAVLSGFFIGLFLLVFYFNVSQIGDDGCGGLGVPDLISVGPGLNGPTRTQPLKVRPSEPSAAVGLPKTVDFRIFNTYSTSLTFTVEANGCYDNNRTYEFDVKSILVEIPRNEARDTRGSITISDDFPFKAICEVAAVGTDEEGVEKVQLKRQVVISRLLGAP